MGHDAFAHRGLGSAALVIIGALHARAAQTVAELVGSSSVSRATLYRTLRRLADHGLVHPTAVRPGPWHLMLWRASVGTLRRLRPKRSPSWLGDGAQSRRGTGPRASHPGARRYTPPNARRTNGRWSGCRNTAARPW